MTNIKAYGCAIIAKLLQPTDTKGARIKLYLPEAGDIHKPLIVGWHTAERAADLVKGGDGEANNAEIYTAALTMYLDKLRADGFTGEDQWRGASTKDGYTFVPVRDEPASLYMVEFQGPFCAYLTSEIVMGTRDQVTAWAENYQRAYGSKRFVIMPVSAIPMSQWANNRLECIQWANL